ncbi:MULTISPECIES: 1-deoxy-D-xylulose-5-phosphate synthase [Pseudomonas]|jgi:1-deoxy-D-xylulose-5-phosphate synthase|uniref:1-deoxy-D-xylulose-5-phosphate synthase n=18 Tax=Gammaproteobacteria TaxID=1236 RepID=DXS_PSEAE|nr:MULTISPECIES: 1-deoxy-D-xylulose-5-phosphate synthase [Pseudomonas]NP_252733.1 1-deoxy-D-xylulose-5-phosphate synthase [Pseudomonas aeruginosa PAO1]B7V7R4.1 RecName: Full=1-deoxy-D-xylulose-5-phosphate synthase; AltName: Full=1-deoxyxylulose-5-phosphate synthase; Short=DXP synthase; Short=DXPS [Pseudomonas aeruginosa LESB58]Q02SL1.1 RecName: Full=1-deoxy-D-xylulose-5-phosphate synthase; AltName: Full=1-deoxyxylulose-5-phosphate synthase; Short=DXP synthase; Short=DXPS [Pseudomonas aeruginosa 
MPKTLHEIPRERPATPLLDRASSPAELRRLGEADLETLADELRQYLLYTVGQTGGHFGAGLGVVELTIALHYVFDTPDDRLVWDVGHQAYPHKILTERRELMGTLRQKNGLAAFPRRAESEYDTFGVGHSSTSISAALGMAIAARLQGKERKSVAVIGDGALTAGMAFEALNHASEVDADMLVILNDNDMSISHNVGGLSNYLAKILSSRTYSSMREGSKKVLSRLPGAWEIARRTEEYAKGMLVPGTLFEELGWNYIGPIDGHDLPTLVATLRNMRDMKGPQFLHVVTKKGKGFAPAELDPIGYHAITKLEAPGSAPKKTGGPKYSSVFGQWLCDMAAQDARLLGITPAMKEGSDLVAFSERYPERYFDVAIAEQHAVTLAAGMACEGMKPVVAIYSTFLQRAYDQLIHDVAVQHLDVLFAIDRAGLVGEDGPTHAGSFDISYLRCIPGMLVMTPSDEDELRKLLTTGYLFDGPAAVRYPRGSGPNHPIDPDLQPVEIGKGVVRRRGGRVALLVFGVQLAEAMKVAESLDATVVDMRFVKPLDEALVRELAGSHELLVTIEENAVMGGAGSAVGEFLASEGLEVPLLQLGLPDYYVEHAKPSEMLAECGLDAAGIEKAVRQRLDRQ